MYVYIPQSHLHLPFSVLCLRSFSTGCSNSRLIIGDSAFTPTYPFQSIVYSTYRPCCAHTSVQDPEIEMAEESKTNADSVRKPKL